MKELLVDICLDCFRWALTRNGEVLQRGIMVPNFDEIHNIAILYDVPADSVWLDARYRKRDVLAALDRYCYWQIAVTKEKHAEIEAACHPLGFPRTAAVAS